MKIRGTFLFLCLILIGLLPGCASKRNQKRMRQEIDTRIKTSIDVPLEFQEQNLERLGISSDVGQLKAIEEQEASPAPSLPPEPTTQETISDQQDQTLAAQIASEAQEPSIEFQLENADLEILMNQISELFDVTFIADDSIAPMLQGTKSIKQHKVSFKTQRPLTKKEAWELFLTFLEIAGFTVISEPQARLKRIVTLDAARKSPLPSFIGVSPTTLPDSDEMIRYVYFLENAAIETIEQILKQLQSPGAVSVLLREMKGFMITDKAYNIKSLMNIIKELDKATMPQAMSVLKLRRADAVEVEKLYKELAGTTDKDMAQQRFFPGRKMSASTYFPDNVGIFADRRTNSLILLGPADAIKRIEDFITQSVDVELSQPYSPLQVLPIRYADATTIANIMNDVTKFGANTEAGRSGGVRNGDKFLKPMSFTPEPETNQVIVKGDYEDFLKAKEIIVSLDQPQPQVAIEVLLLSVSLNEQKQLGAQLRSRVPGTEGFLGANTHFQTSGLFGNRPIVENPNGNGVNRLLGNLLNLVSGQTLFGGAVAAGNTIISLGDQLSTWAIIQALESVSNVQVLSNPFLVATNKTKASVSLGEIRRLITGTIIGTSETNTFGDATAQLVVSITPQINSDGMIILDIRVELSQFVGVANPENAVRTTREIKTKTIVANKEVLALGGLIQNNIENSQTKVPILGDIPILGWLFKNKQKTDSKSNLLILISSRIIEPEANQTATAFTNNHLSDYTDTINEMYRPAERRDPVNRWFFNRENLNESATDEFIFRQQQDALAKTNLNKDVVIPIARNIHKASPSKTVLAQHKNNSSKRVIAQTKSRIKPATQVAQLSNTDTAHTKLAKKEPIIIAQPSHAKRSLVDMLASDKEVRS